MHPSLNSFLNYIEFEKRYSRHTLESYRNDLAQFETFLNPFEKELAQATHTDIRNWIVSMMEKGISSRSVNRKISSLKSYFKFLLRKGEINKNPMVKIQTPKTSKRLPVFVELTATERLLSQIEFSEGFEGQLEKIILELLYGTGMRRSELINLKKSGFDPYNSQIKVLGKGNKERIIPLHYNLCETIKSFIAENQQATEYVLTDAKGKKLTEAFVYTTVKKYLSMVTTVDKKSPHTLRHTFATHLMNNGADINAVKELLGHSSLAATQVYTHNTIDKLKEIYNRAHPKA